MESDSTPTAIDLLTPPPAVVDRPMRPPASTRTSTSRRQSATPRMRQKTTVKSTRTISPRHNRRCKQIFTPPFPNPFSKKPYGKYYISFVLDKILFFDLINIKSVSICLIFKC